MKHKYIDTIYLDFTCLYVEVELHQFIARVAWSYQYVADIGNKIVAMSSCLGDITQLWIIETADNARGRLCGMGYNRMATGQSLNYVNAIHLKVETWTLKT